MKVTGIIAEYNPFTNGHKYQIDRIRESGSDYIIAVMSGDFVQRGEPAIIDKYARTAMALRNGVDLVLELPVCFAASDAGIFAGGGVSMLHRLGVVNELSFGVEKGYEDLVSKISAFLNDTPTAYDEELDKKLRAGLSYPKARTAALSLFFTAEELEGIDNPNVILGIEYSKVLHQLNSSIVAAPLTRIGADFNDLEPDDSGLSSATAVRKMIEGGFDPDMLMKHIPTNCVDILTDNYNKNFPMNIRDFSSVIRYKLLTEDSLDVYTDVIPSFAAHIKNNINSYEDITSFIDGLKTKNITRASVSRLLTHILLNMKGRSPKAATYARVLGFGENAAPLLSEIKKQASIPLISKLADADDNPYIKQDILASHIYEAVKSSKFSSESKNEYRQEIIKGL